MASRVDTALTKTINILLLGKTGVGKSTFINAFVNYLQYEDFNTAQKHEPTILIPINITVTDADYNDHIIKQGEDSNEFQGQGAAATQDVRTYKFPIKEKNILLNIIDTPGMGDPRGINKDNHNAERILTYLAQIKEVHGICFLMTPANNRNTIFFEYCFDQILSRLHTSACKNIIFVFTNSRGTYYKPSGSSATLKEFFKKIEEKSPDVKIPYGKQNVFCLDNEGFIFCIALRNGVNLENEVIQGASQSWEVSANECGKLFAYVSGEDSQNPLAPHQLDTTLSINKARRIIVQLSQPAADISQAIDDNIRTMEQHRHKLKQQNYNLEELKKNLFVPSVDIQQEPLEKASTICTSTRCSEVVSVDGINKWHYTQICCNECLAKSWGFGLFICSAINFSGTCKKCSCDMSQHRHLYYLTKMVHGKKIDPDIQSKVTDKTSAKEEITKIIEEMDQKQKELESEREIIIDCLAKFTLFLKKHAISPAGDAYRGYIEYLIRQEESLDSKQRDSERIKNFTKLLDSYEILKKNMESGEVKGVETTAEEIKNLSYKLFTLKHFGGKIKELFDKEEALRAQEQCHWSKHVFVNITNRIFKGKNWNPLKNFF